MRRPAAWSAALPAFLMTFNLLLLNEFPDEEADRIRTVQDAIDYVVAHIS